MDAIGQVLEGVIQQTSPPAETTASGYTCPHCGRQVAPMNITILGRNRTVQPRCGCEWQAVKAKITEAEEKYRQDRVRQLFSVSRLGERFTECRFETFIVRPGTEIAFRMVRRYCEEFDSWKGVAPMLWGPPGCGKSHLAAAVTHELIRRGKTVVFQSVPELLARIRGTYGDDARESERDVMAALMDCDLLVLDDLGAERVTDWVQDTLFRLIDGRYRAAKSIMVTTNLEPRDLAAILGVRMADRLIEMTIPIQMQATSYRQERARERILEMMREA